MSGVGSRCQQEQGDEHDLRDHSDRYSPRLNDHRTDHSGDADPGSFNASVIDRAVIQLTA